MTIAFEPWPKIARLNRDILITEKIDGTNAAVRIVPVEGSGIETVTEEIDGEVRAHFVWDQDPVDPPVVARVGGFYVFAQSRTRFITPGKLTDNYGFAGWVETHADALVDVLGPGTHFGEWWGSGIQRGYGLTKGEKRFSLFNSHRWGDTDFGDIPELRVVPTLYRGPFDQGAINRTLDNLRDGSWAAALEGFFGSEAEGIVIYVAAARTSFKVTLKGDAEPKGAAAHAHDEEKVAA